MGQCAFFNKHADVNGDGKFDWSDVKEIGSSVFGFLKSTAELLKMYAPALEAAGVSSEKFNNFLTQFNDALDLSADIVKQLELVGIPRSLADFAKAGDVNKDGKKDINDMIAYVGMTKRTLEKAHKLASGHGKLQLEASIAKLDAISKELLVIKKAQDDAALTEIAADMAANP